MIYGSMYRMTTGKGVPLTSTIGFLLGTVGSVVAQRFADRIEPLDLKPKHVGLLAVLAASEAPSQLEVATTMGVVPSLVVRLADHLEDIGAVERARDPGDRRRQTLRLTDQGWALLAECATITRSLEAEVLTGLATEDKKALRSALRHLAGNLGLKT